MFHSRPALAFLLAGLATVVVVTGCATPGPGPGGASSDADLDRVAALLTGWFDSAEQAVRAPDDFLDIRLVMVPIWTHRADGCWLYVEQAASSALARPYRQRIYHVHRDDTGALRSDVHTLPGDPLDFAAGWADTDAFVDAFADMGPADLERRDGCSIILERTGTNAFTGSTVGTGCTSTLRGASSATSEVAITRDLIVSWDRGWDDAGEQVWGATAGGYEFRRRGDVPPPPARVATDAVFPPFHDVDENGELVGYDLDVARAALARAGEDARFVRAPAYAALFEGLVAGEHDVVAATTGITAERQALYGFTRPYFETCLAVLVRAGTGEPRTLEDLTGRRLAASAGTTSVAAARSIGGATVVETRRAAESLARLRSGDVDGIVIDEFEAVPWSRDADDLEVLAEPVAVERYGLVLRKDDVARRVRLDAALEAMEADGTLAAIRARHGLDRAPDWPVTPPAR